MALVRDGLWGVVSGTETALEGGSDQAKFLDNRDRTLTILFYVAVNSTLLYLFLLGDPEDPVVILAEAIEYKEKVGKYTSP